MQREPLYFGGVTSFEAVWEGFGEQDTAVVFGLLVGMLVGFSDLGVLGSSLVSLFRRRQWRRGLRRSCVSK